MPPEVSQLRALPANAYLGTRLDVSSAPALCRFRWRTLPGRRPLGLLPSGLLLARARALAPIPSLVSRAVAAGLRRRSTAFLYLPPPASGPLCLRGYLAPLRQAEWVVYAKAPFAGPQQVLDYVGRYTHRVAISNNRLLDLEDDQVQFRYKDYRNRSQQKVMTLSADEFIRRFLLHVLPDGFQRIRYYGFLSNRHREEKLERCRQHLGMASAHPTTPATEPPKDYRDRYEELTGVSL